MADPTQPPHTQSAGRRRFLKTALGSAVVFAGTPLAFATADATEVAAIFEDLKVLSTPQADALLKVARSLFPHDFLGDSFYAHAAKKLDQAAATDKQRAQMITDGLKQLPADFRSLQTGRREAMLNAISDTAFFKFVRRTTIGAVYGNPEVWKHFGYPGPSAVFGGWVNRDLVDIDWLPQVSS